MKLLFILTFAFCISVAFANEEDLQKQTNSIILNIYPNKVLNHKTIFTNCNKIKLVNYERAPLCLKLENDIVNKFTVIIELPNANESRLVGTFNIQSSKFDQIEFPINTLYKGGNNCLGRPVNIVVLSETENIIYITVIKEWFAQNCGSNVSN